MRLLNKFKIYDNELCPCGSKKTYTLCCKGRKDKIDENNKRKPIEVLMIEALRKQLFKCCLYPDQSRCVKHIKNAHALQNNKILSKLAVDGHVYMLNPKKKPLIIPVKKGEVEVLTLMDRVGVGNATTYTCFCDIHDDEVFAAIEKGACAFDKKNNKQKFLYAYKAFIFEYYKELVFKRIFQNQIKNKPSLLKNRIVVAQYRNMLKKEEEMEKYKTFFDNGLLTDNYSELNTCVVEIPEEIEFANYACIAPDYDLLGKRIKNFDRQKEHYKYIFLTAFPEDGKSYILVSFLDSDAKTYYSFFEQLKTFELDTIKFYFTLILPLYSENVVLSPRLWESWDEMTQMAFTFYANRKGNQFYIYKKMVSFILKNIRKNKPYLGDGNRGLIDLFKSKI